jgi:hypothetical protein
MKKKAILAIGIVSVFLLISIINLSAVEMVSNDEDFEEPSGTTDLIFGGTIFGFTREFDGLQKVGLNGVSVQLFGIGVPNRVFKSPFVNLETITYTRVVPDVGESDGFFEFAYDDCWLPKPGVYVLIFSKEGYLPNIKFKTLEFHQSGYSSIDVTMLKRT